MNKVKEATVLLEEAGQAEQPLVMVSFHLGAMAHQRGDLATAGRYLLKKLNFIQDIPAFRLLKDVYVATKNWDGMIRLAQRALESRNTVEWSHIKALGLFNRRDYGLPPKA